MVPSAEMGRPEPLPSTSSESSRFPVGPPAPVTPDVGTRLVPEPVPPATGSSLPRETPPLPAPLRLDRIASIGGLQGQVLTSDRVPQGHALVTLVSTTQPGMEQRFAADGDGRFAVRLPSGEWAIVTQTQDGRWVTQGRVRVRERETAKVTIVGE